MAIEMERCYYKVTDKTRELFKNCSEFLNREAELRKIQIKAIKARVPKFEKYRARKGIYRIATYTGFVFENPEELDPKEWKTELFDGCLLSTPNKRTKKGKEMMKFLRSFERTYRWDVDSLLNIDKQKLNGSFYPSELFKFHDCIFIMIDSKYRKIFEDVNKSFIEITYGEMNKAIKEYNAFCI